MKYNKYKNIYQRNFIRLENVFDVSILNEIESIAKQHPPSNDNGDSNSQYRRNTLSLTPNSKISIPSTFLDNVQNSISYANNIFNMDLNNIEIVYVEYEPQPSGFDWHLDIGPYPYNLRKLSFSINVNHPDEYEGGDLEFQFVENNSNIPPKLQGGITIFPSFLPHRITPITKGIRKAIIGFIQGPPYK